MQWLLVARHFWRFRDHRALTVVKENSTIGWTLGWKRPSTTVEILMCCLMPKLLPILLKGHVAIHTMLVWILINNIINSRDVSLGCLWCKGTCHGDRPIWCLIVWIVTEEVTRTVHVRGLRHNLRGKVLATTVVAHIQTSLGRSHEWNLSPGLIMQICPLICPKQFRAQLRHHSSCILVRHTVPAKHQHFFLLFYLYLP